MRSSAASWRWLGVGRCEIAREPIQHIRPQPADLPATVAAFLRKSTQQHEPRDDELGPAGEASYVVGAQELLKGRKRFVDPAREGDGRAREDCAVGKRKCRIHGNSPLSEWSAGSFRRSTTFDTGGFQGKVGGTGFRGKCPGTRLGANATWHGAQSVNSLNPRPLKIIGTHFSARAARVFACFAPET